MDPEAKYYSSYRFFTQDLQRLPQEGSYHPDFYEFHQVRDVTVQKRDEALHLYLIFVFVWFFNFFLKPFNPGMAS